MTQVNSRSRSLAVKIQPKLVAVNKKMDSREARRESKAEVAAKLEQTIEAELLERLRKGVYGTDGIVNEQQESFIKALDTLQDLDKDVQSDYDEDDGEMEMEDGILDREFVSDISDDDVDDIEDMEDDDESNNSDESMDEQDSKPVIKKRRCTFIIYNLILAGPYVNIEYEEERESVAAQTQAIDF